jgi:hypothetical protein
MGFAAGFQVGWGAGQDIAAGLAVKREKKRAGKLLEEFKAQLEEFQLSDNELTYYEKVQLSFLANQIGSTYAKSYDEITSAQASYDKEKMVQEYQSLSKKNELFATLIKEIKDNKYLSQADLSALDEITGLPLSKLWNKETMDKIKNDELSTEEFNNKLGIAKTIGTDYAKPYLEQQGVIEPGLKANPPAPTGLSAKDNWAIEHYNLPEGSPEKISFDQLCRYMGATPETPERATALENDIAAMKEYGASNEEIKNHLIGKSNTPKTGTSPSVQDYLFNVDLGFGIVSSKDLNALTPQDKTDIANIHNTRKQFLNPEALQQVEAYLTGFEIDLNPPTIPTPEEAPLPEPEAKPGPIQKGINYMKKVWNSPVPTGTIPKAPTPTLSIEQKEALISSLSKEELFNQMKGLDPSDPMYKLLYAEAQKRGYIEE